MTDALPARAPAPDFDQPIAVLKHCHDQIRRRLAALEALLAPDADADAEATRQAAADLLRGFEPAADAHHEDEERDLMPMLQARAQGDDAALLATLVPALLAEHRAMERAWAALRAPLRALADGLPERLPDAAARAFVDAYARHMATEEAQLAPMALRLFDAAQMAQLGAALRRRRGIAAAPAARAVADLRIDYSRASLSEADVLADPTAQFAKWFDEALQADVNEPNAMSLATVGADGKPSSRIVLIKEFDQRGFTWYTNYASHKGADLAAHPHAALLFFWSELERQVRIEGRVEKTSAAESDYYYDSRPLNSRIGAIASAQSAPIPDRAAMEARFAAAAAQWGERPQRPAHWGGYRLVPERIEFWQGRPSRFHDRIVFARQADGSWQMRRLQP